MHGLFGDRSMGGRFDRLCAALAAAGMSPHAFDAPAVVTLESHMAALREVVSGCHGPVALFGQSWGSLVCTTAFPDLPMVLAAPVLAPIRYRWEDFFSPGQLATGRLHVGRTVVPQATLDLFAAVETPRLSRPPLLIHGDQGWEEQTLLAGTRSVLAQLPKGTRLEVMHGADHSLRARYEDVISLSIAWLGTLRP